MTSDKHEKILQVAIEKLRESGYRVIRLDKRRRPDAIAVDFKNKKIIAVEASTNAVNYHFVRKRVRGQFDEDIIITDQYSNRYYSREAYLLALQLRKEGKIYNEIRDAIEEKFGKRPSNSTIHDWTTGRKAPPEVSHTQYKGQRTWGIGVT